ncbi:MAG: glutaredoxin domain-containing protein [Candidatus Pacebacteria bacterium]|nr:glutaredoxin domain-containing protein [Candidatus Paceibacterota bacterium]
MKKVIVFSTPACAFCYSLKEYLKKKNIEFEEIDISENETARQEVIDNTKQMGVPVLKIDQEYIIGFDKNKIDELL